MCHRPQLAVDRRFDACASTETTAAAISAGGSDRVAVLDRSRPTAESLRQPHFKRSGRVSATLGEVRHRADLVVFWSVDPVSTHPRHLERYSVEPRGRFVPEGRGARAVVVLDAERSATAERADVFVTCSTEAAVSRSLWTPRAMRSCRGDRSRCVRG